MAYKAPHRGTTQHTDHRDCVLRAAHVETFRGKVPAVAAQPALTEGLYDGVP